VPDSRGRFLRGRLRASPVLGGLMPVHRSGIAADELAGITLAAVSIPVALGYAKIAGMPVVTGLYTLLLPMAVFAILGSSRHLVVGADSATAAILGAALAGLAVPGSPHYVRLAGLAALLAGGLLLLARLGFLANFLSRTVLLGFLTGVGIQVAARQLPDMLSVTVPGTSTVARLLGIARALPHLHGADVAVSAGVIVIVLVSRGEATSGARRSRRPSGNGRQIADTSISALPSIASVRPRERPQLIGGSGMAVAADQRQAGYRADRQATAEALQSGWLRTGDIGYFDQRGFLYLTDRSKDVIITGGSNVYPREVEEALLIHPGVHEAAVIGVADPVWGESVRACVVAVPGWRMETEELIAHCREHLASFKKPKFIICVDELPKSPNGKILKRILRTRLSS